MGSFGAGGSSDEARGRVVPLSVVSVLPMEGSVGLEGLVLGSVGAVVEGVGLGSEGSVTSGSEGVVLD